MTPRRVLVTAVHMIPSESIEVGKTTKERGAHGDDERGNDTCLHGSSVPVALNGSNGPARMSESIRCAFRRPGLRQRGFTSGRGCRRCEHGERAHVQRLMTTVGPGPHGGQVP